MADKPFKSTSYDAAQDITEAQDGFLIEQPSFAGVRKQTWILFSSVRAWILTFSEFAQMTYNKSAIAANKNQIENNKGEIDGHSVDINNNSNAINSNVTDIGNNTTAIGVNAGNISDNDTDIGNLQNKTPQSYKTTDAVEFVSVKSSVYFIEESSKIAGDIYDEMIISVLKDVGDICIVSGTANISGLRRNISFMERKTSTQIYVYTYNHDSGALITVIINSASASVWSNVLFCTGIHKV
jgi:hypothetical protein